MTGRTVLALGLFAGFYLVGLGLVAALLWLPWAQICYMGEIPPSGWIALVGAAYIAWALVPPLSRWSPPGPELTHASAPGLYALVEEVADAVAHPVPQSIYVVTGANAFASSRPLWYGLRRQPVLGIGLSLFSILDRPELSAVIAHEFGHHMGGDVRLGPWLHRTFQAIATALGRLNGSNVFLHLPFYAYGRLFMRLTGTASREQELRADAVAARIAGAGALGAALVAVERHDDSWNEYWHGFYVPAINAGFLLPMLEGYRRYVSAACPDGSEGDRPATRPPAPEDTHPPLEARLAALRLSPRLARAAGGTTLDLLSDVSATERALLATLLTDETVLPKLTRASWDDWGRDVLPAVWRCVMGERLAVLRGVDIAELPSLLAEDSGWWDRLRAGVNVFSPEGRRRQLRLWVAQWLALSLLALGFAVVSAPGGELLLQRGGLRVSPFQWIDDLGAGRVSQKQWAAFVAQVSASEAG